MHCRPGPALVVLGREHAPQGECGEEEQGVLGSGDAQEAWCGELPPEGWCVEVALDRLDHAGALELMSLHNLTWLDAPRAVQANRGHHAYGWCHVRRPEETHWRPHAKSRLHGTWLDAPSSPAGMYRTGLCRGTGVTVRSSACTA